MYEVSCIVAGMNKKSLAHQSSGASVHSCNHKRWGEKRKFYNLGEKRQALGLMDKRFGIVKVYE